MSNTKKIKPDMADDLKQIEEDRSLIMGALSDLFAENEMLVRNNIIGQLNVHLKGNDSEHDKALQLAIRIVRSGEQE